MIGSSETSDNYRLLLSLAPPLHPIWLCFRAFLGWVRCIFLESYLKLNDIAAGDIMLVEIGKCCIMQIADVLKYVQKSN